MRFVTLGEVAIGARFSADHSPRPGAVSVDVTNVEEKLELRSIVVLTFLGLWVAIVFGGIVVDALRKRSLQAAFLSLLSRVLHLTRIVLAVLTPRNELATTLAVSGFFAEPTPKREQPWPATSVVLWNNVLLQKLP